MTIFAKPKIPSKILFWKVSLFLFSNDTYFRKY